MHLQTPSRGSAPGIIDNYPRGVAVDMKNSRESASGSLALMLEYHVVKTKDDGPLTGLVGYCDHRYCTESPTGICKR
jgi:hypothetical protein